ncbi:hypothetical protein S7711_09224 [Stachybotrys chartarum IBT 7711]|uniref:Uncharacterized protein n=1 Tax=Stachybotrys chartarum (strain CBS 109288 / IBT 7711) TaxID=1280523 RepID=A0A084ALN2_STACB|nr:hypothetical protein S7711_09224 [Stachybotrys chartarum IBT 7711]KFA46968.1 hypothetical protein S40293_10037 [Stachybotrys chartarum IBT 40293]
MESCPNRSPGHGDEQRNGTSPRLRVYHRSTNPSTETQSSKDAATEVLRILETTTQTTLKPLVIFKIDRKAYYSVAERLEQTLRYFDYDPDREILTIRMPTPIHEFFTASLNRYIERQLESIASRPGEAGEVASKIESGGSSRILLREGIPEGNCPLQHHPDGQFFYEHGKYPIVVLEISYSQARKRLRKLAQDYILYSNGNIKLVIGIDINYKNKESQEATVSLWRPKYTRQDEDDDVLEVEQKMINHPFRASNGEAINETDNIHIDLRDFSPDEIPRSIEPTMLSIPFGLLDHSLRRAERRQQEIEVNPSVKPEPQTKKRKLSSSSIEELDPYDEKRFLEKEKQVAARAEREDKDYL